MITPLQQATLLACAIVLPAHCQAQDVSLQSFSKSTAPTSAFVLHEPAGPNGDKNRPLPLSDDFSAMVDASPLTPSSGKGEVPPPLRKNASRKAALLAGNYLAFPRLGGCTYAPYVPNPKLSFETERRRAQWYPVMANAACDAGVPVNLFDALITQESRYLVSARSSKGATGLAQLMPASARFLGVGNVWDPEQNMRGGARYLRLLLNEFGRFDLALAAYNAGAGRVRTIRRVPRIQETVNYVSKILLTMRDQWSRQSLAVGHIENAAFETRKEF